MKILIYFLLLICSSLAAQSDKTQFLITSVRTGNTEVFSVNPVNGDARNITMAPNSEERYPAWHPDGTKIIFTSNREDGKTFDYYIADADGSHLKKLSNLPPGSVAYWGSFTADGEWVYFNEGNSGNIYKIRPDGTQQTEITHGRDSHISPDGTKLVYTEMGKKAWGVWLMNSDGSNRRQIISAESEIGGVAPVWSYDGNKIAFSMQTGDFAEIFSCNSDGSDLKQLTYLKQISSSPCYSPDGSYITFRVTDEAYWRDSDKMKQTYAAREADKRPVWIMNADGTNARVVEVLRYQCAMDGSRAEVYEY